MSQELYLNLELKLEKGEAKGKLNHDIVVVESK